MSSLFRPIDMPTAIAELAELPRRIKAQTYITRRGTEGRNLREQARQHLRWYQLLITMNQRVTP